ncbi:MAG: malonate decarboxylase holo-[acyl-carrier-protein] synthase [Pseudomonadota bacterium]
MAEIPRHHLAWVDPGITPADLLPGLEAAPVEAVLDWIALGRPAIARRSGPCDAPGGVPLGVPLPPRRGKRRIAFSVPAQRIAAVRAPLLLEEAIASLPPAWRGPLAHLDAGLHLLGLTARVYGSASWQHLTGEPYVTPDSDVDLLLEPGERKVLDGALALLSRWEREAGLRADGEVVLPGGAAVAWRELALGRGMLLLKHRRWLELWPRSRVLALLERAA